MWNDNITTKKFIGIKQNKYGFDQDRKFIIDIDVSTFRIYDLLDICKSEFSFNSISRSDYNAEINNRCYVYFKDRDKYYLKFNTAEETIDFVTTLNQALGLYKNLSDRIRSKTEVNSLTSSYNEKYIAKKSVFSYTNSPPNEIKSLPPIETNFTYRVMKISRHDIPQERILVLNPIDSTLRILHTNSKVAKEIYLKDLAAIDSIVSNDGDHTRDDSIHLVFINDQRPFKLIFHSPTERVQFCEQVAFLMPTLRVKDSTTNDVELEDNLRSLRFKVTKINNLGAYQQRYIYLETYTRLIRSVNPGVSRTDIPLKRLTRIEKPFDDKLRALVFFDDNEHNYNLIFDSTLARDQFVGRLSTLAYLTKYTEPPVPHLPYGPHAAIDVPRFVICDVNFDPSKLNKKSSIISSTYSDPIELTKLDFEKNLDLEFERPNLEIEWNNRVGPYSLFVGSWNVGNSAFPTNQPISDWIPASKHFDMYVIGLQECSTGERENWILETLNYLNQSSSSNQYCTVVTMYLWEMVIMVIVKSDLLINISNVQTSTIATGVGDVIGNKGAVGVSFNFYDSSLCFICCHLAARKERIEKRKDHFCKIAKGLKLGRKDVDLFHQFNHLIWFGDLNYRVEKDWDEVIELVAQKDWLRLQASDQLLDEMSKFRVFAEFKEGNLNFAPTYRWEKFKEDFSNKRFQAPSWTDRILYLSPPDSEDLLLVEFGGAHALLGSDHRPISTLFQFNARVPYHFYSLPQVGSCVVLIEDILLQVPIVSIIKKEWEENSDNAMVSISITSSVLEEECRAPEVKFDASRQMWHWNAFDLPVTRPFLCDPSFLIDEVFAFSFQIRNQGKQSNQESENFYSFGHTWMPLRQAFYNALNTEPNTNSAGSSTFTSLVSKDGVVLGRVTIKYSAYTNGSIHQDIVSKLDTRSKLSRPMQDSIASPKKAALLEQNEKSLEILRKKIQEELELSLKGNNTDIPTDSEDDEEISTPQINSRHPTLKNKYGTPTAVEYTMPRTKKLISSDPHANDSRRSRAASAYNPNNSNRNRPASVYEKPSIKSIFPQESPTSSPSNYISSPSQMSRTIDSSASPNKFWQMPIDEIPSLPAFNAPCPPSGGSASVSPLLYDDDLPPPPKIPPPLPSTLNTSHMKVCFTDISRPPCIQPPPPLPPSLSPNTIPEDLHNLPPSILPPPPPLSFSTCPLYDDLPSVLPLPPPLPLSSSPRPHLDADTLIIPKFAPPPIPSPRK